MKISSVSVKLTLTGFLAVVVAFAFFFLVVFDTIFCFFLGGMVMLSAKETTLADRLRATGDDRFRCVGNTLLFLFVLVLVSFVKGDSTTGYFFWALQLRHLVVVVVVVYLPLSSQLLL
jgi:hypothetical protein